MEAPTLILPALSSITFSARSQPMRSDLGFYLIDHRLIGLAMLIVLAATCEFGYRAGSSKQAMSDSFMRSLGIPPPNVNLGIGSGTHAEQVGRTMIEFEKVVREWRPDWIVVVGDVNATCACSITAKKELVALAHIEAGLRSFDLTMPEEINRMVTDRLSDLLFTPDEISDRNLLHEGVPPDRICRVGNIMIDTLERHREAAARLDTAEVVTANLVQPQPEKPCLRQ